MPQVFLTAIRDAVLSSVGIVWPAVSAKVKHLIRMFASLVLLNRIFLPMTLDHPILYVECLNYYVITK